jgi:hypothetical protein
MTPKQRKYKELEGKMVQKVYSPPLSEKSGQSGKNSSKSSQSEEGKQRDPSPVPYRAQKKQKG